MNRSNGDPGIVPTPFACSLAVNEQDAAWIHLAGELDLTTAPELGEALRRAQSTAETVVLDLRQLTFIDCSGLHAIVPASVRARRAGHRLILLRGPRKVDRLFAAAGVSDSLDIDDSPYEPALVGGRPPATDAAAPMTVIDP